MERKTYLSGRTVYDLQGNAYREIGEWEMQQVVQK